MTTPRPYGSPDDRRSDRLTGTADPSADAVVCRAVRVGYGGPPVVVDLDLTVRRDEVVALLGPSGSGKTTLLAAIAGFIPLEGGEIRIDGVIVAGGGHHVPPERRGVAVVFQSAALWPHLDALDTVAYPMRRRGIGRDDARRAAGGLLDRLGIGALANRRPAELSGGEQQRVGLGRALAREASVLLFDEPTAHLDPDLRSRLQDEIATERRRTAAAAIYATHDPGEALAVADRVALLRAGRLVQLGTPDAVYDRPIDVWAARLTGPASVIPVTVLERGPHLARLVVGGAQMDVRVDGPEGAAWALIRPEWARLGGDLPGRVVGVAYRGGQTDYTLQTPAGQVGVSEAGGPTVDRGAAPGWRLDRIWLVEQGDGPTRT